MPRIITLIVFIFCAYALKAQEQGILVRAILYKGDTIPSLQLPEVVVKAKTRNPAHYRRYNQRLARLEYNVRKVYPYAQIAAAKINEIEKRLAKVSREAEKKKIIKEEYSSLMKTFKTPLMKLSVTQGRILVRLIYRETNASSFSHIREYKGGVNAYFWQSIALIFGNNLKAHYDPYGADAEIEAIVQKILKKE